MASNMDTRSVEIETETISQIGQAKNAILKFLSELGIDRIVYVDDRCSIQELREAFIGKLKSFYTTKPKELAFVDWELPAPVFDSKIEKIWDDVGEDEQRKMFLSVLNIENNQEELENSVAPLKLKEHLEDKIDLLSPLDWVSRKDGIIKELSDDKKILFLFDIEFKYAPLEGNRDGRDLAVELLSSEEVKDFVYCGLFSHLFSVEQEAEKKNEYCNSHSLDKKKFYTISKKRFQADSYLPGLAEGIRNTLLINEVEFLKKQSSEILKKSFKDSLAVIDNLDPDSFNHIIQKSSRKEGIWEMATLIRVSTILTKDKALNNLLSKSKRAVINKNLSKIRGLEKIDTGGETPFDKTQIQELRSNELYIDGNTLNKLHFPLSNGDIFKIKGREYILLVQPCNLALRSSGEREIMSGKVHDSAFLLEVFSEKKDKFKRRDTFCVIQEADSVSNKIKFVKFPLFKTVSLSPLDLTVFNEDGKAIINLNKSDNDSSTIQDSWKLRYRKLHGEFTNYRDNIRAFKKLKSAGKNNLKDLIYYGGLFKGYRISNENVLNTKANKISFDIQRVRYYREPYSTDLLQLFMQYLSRNAFDRDFSKD